MDAAIKKKWIKALRSGKYKQTPNVLMNDDGAMCCLGVLAVIQGVPKDRLLYKMTENIPDGKHAGLPNISRRKLARMNDQGKTFEQIADYIARHYD